MTLEELSEAVRQELLARHLIVQDGRISSTPDLRTIRYYTTLGLLDKPKVIGQKREYERRHLLQLLAIKVLQAANFSLSEIQARLYGRSDAELEALLSSTKQSPKLQLVTWHEIPIEPGLKLLIQDGWTLQNIDETTHKITSALTAISRLQTAGQETT
ncbi:MAG: MerR family transcriptional regulator [Acidobacteriota bacterium]|nr:MerR family transcriptional regulator [Blastocatellia bacterium]MDW8411574.1 MerR family transcriptional regulator [Acidobacteriota bacterium]